MIDLKLGAAQRFVKDVRRVRAPALEQLRTTPMSDGARARLTRFEEEFGGLVVECTSGLEIELSAVWDGQIAVGDTDWGEWDGEVAVDPPMAIEGARIAMAGDGSPVAMNLANGDVIELPNMPFGYFPEARDFRSWLIKRLLHEEMLRGFPARHAVELFGDRATFDAVCAAAMVVPPPEASDDLSCFVVGSDLAGRCLLGQAWFLLRTDDYARGMIERLDDRVGAFRLRTSGRGFAPNASLLAEVAQFPLRRRWDLDFPRCTVATLELRTHRAQWALVQHLADDRSDETLVLSSLGRAFLGTPLNEHDDIPY